MSSCKSTGPAEPHDSDVCTLESRAVFPDFGSASQPGAEGEQTLRVLQAGTMLDLAYRIVGTLGRGGMGEVLLAWDVSLERHVAIKLVAPNLTTAEYREGFLHEARALARISHPNVVTVHSFGETSERPFYVMEYLPGGNLRTWVDARGGAPVEVALALEALSQIAAGLGALWDAGLCHGDLKPANVLVGLDGRLVLTDVGLAFHQAAHPGTFVGTPGYAAPELVVGGGTRRALGGPADIYALGVVAYELFTGRKPFTDRTRTAMLSSHVLKSPPRPSEVSPDLPTTLDAPLLAALAKDPALRPSNPNEFVSALARALPERSVFKGRTVTIVDDDNDFLELSRAALQAGLAGIEVNVASSAQAALDVIRGGHCDVVVTDLQMDGMDGFALTERIRRESGTAIRVVVATAVGGAPEWRRLSELGADAFLVKPIEPDDLLAVVRRMLVG